MGIELSFYVWKFRFDEFTEPNIIYGMKTNLEGANVCLFPVLRFQNVPAHGVRN